MDRDLRDALIFIGALALLALVIIGSCGIYYGHRNHLVAEMVRSGVNPIQAKCAYTSSAHELFCVESLRLMLENN